MPTRFSRFKARPPKEEIPLRRLSRKGGTKGSRAFDELCQRNLNLLKEAVYRYGNRKEEFANNLHEARLAFWQTLHSGVPQSRFKLKFFEYYKKNVRGEQLPHGHPERTALRLDNPRRNYHELIPDRKTSLNLHSMDPRRTLQPRIPTEKELLRRQERVRERKKAISKEKAAIRAAKLQKENAKWEEINQRNNEKQLERQRIEFKQLQKIFATATKNPFSLPLGDTLKALAQQGPEMHERKMVYSLPKVRKVFRKLMFRIAPAKGYMVKPIKMVKLKPEQYKEFMSYIEEVKTFYRSPTSVYVPKFLEVLERETQRANGNIPSTFLTDIKKFVDGHKLTRSLIRKANGEIEELYSSSEEYPDIPF